MGKFNYEKIGTSWKTHDIISSGDELIALQHEVDRKIYYDYQMADSHVVEEETGEVRAKLVSVE